MKYLMIGLLMISAGCSSINVGTVRAYHNEVSPRFIESVQADSRLTNEQKVFLLGVPADFEALLNAKEGK